MSIGGKSQAQHKPTALQTLVNAGVYGAVIQSIYGTTKVNIAPIWAANLRKGGSGKKGKTSKGKKGSPPAFVENVNFLIGSNPIEGCLQAWLNNNRYPLNFINLRTASFNNPSPYPFWGAFNFTDPKFYFVVGVTAEVTLSGAFADFGSPGASSAISNVQPAVNGTGYSIGDQFLITGGSVLARCTVTAIGAGGSCTAFSLDSAGAGYVINSYNVPTVNITGTGSGLLVSIYGVGTPYSGTYEYPLWNAAQHGPDLVNAAGSRWFPYLYYWTPALGATVYVPSNVPGSNGYYHLYYAQISPKCHNQPPITFNRMSFEQVLGSGTEYSDAGLSAQQILYPPYAGLGSSRMDLGSSAMLPDTRIEVKGSHALYSQGDADFADMIEDVIKSGQLQVGSQLGLIHRGVNCNDLPGLVQKSFFGQLEPMPTNHLLYYQPNAAGSILIAFFRWRVSGGTPPTISDTAGNVWTSLFPTSTNMGLWYATAKAATGNVVSGVFNGGGFAYDSRGYAMESDPGSNQVLKTATAQGTNSGSPAPLSVSIYVPQACYILAAGDVAGYDATKPPPHWTDISSPAYGFALGPSLNVHFLMKRYVSAAGVYTFTLQNQTGYYNVGLIAIGGDPSPLPKALGNIIDDASLQLTRTQCRANGLIGSYAMNSQKKASEYLKEFLQCANAAAVWSGGKLKIIPWSEVSAVGNGVVYTAPTASGPVAILTEHDFIGDSSNPPVTFERIGQVDSNNVDQIEHISRFSDYNTSVASQPESGPIALFGPRKKAPVPLHEIQDPGVARKILAPMVRDQVYQRNKYSFKLKAKWQWLEAMDLIGMPEPQLWQGIIYVRLTSIKENESLELECEAEDFIWGLHSPDPDLTVTTAAPYQAPLGNDPGSVNPPIIFEPVPRLYGNQSQPQIEFVVSGSSPDYGGCEVLVSTDGGASYPNSLGGIGGNAITGYTVGDWPAANDPDAANDLAVDLTESLGTLLSYSAADRDEFTYPCYVAGGNAQIPYELMTYNDAVMTASNKYTLKATGAGNELRRAVFGAPAALAGVDHPTNSRWAFLNPSGAGILRVNIDPSWIGKTLYFKFLAVNTLGGNVQDQSAATAYPYTVLGTAQTSNPNASNYTLTGGTLTNPTSTTIHMAQATANFPSNQANYNARTLTIPAPSVPTTYYVTIADPGYVGDTGSGTTLTAYAETTQAKVGQPGFVFIGSIVALPAGGGTLVGAGGQPTQGGIYVNGVLA